jgi:phosphoribosylamine-glycine ligase
MKPEGLLFISNKAETTPVAWELLKEGVPVSYFILDPTCRNAYSGLMPRIRLDGLQAAIEKSQTVVIDIILKNDQSPGHLAFLDKFKIPHTVPGLFGTLGDKLRKPPYSKEVIGGGALPEKVELNREEGIKLARLCGFDIPEYHEFTSLKAGAKFLYGPGKSKLWVFKPHGNAALDLTKVEDFAGELLDLLTTTYPARLGDGVKFILQEKIDGQEVSSEIWVVDGVVLHPNRTLEDKKLNDGNTGPAVGSASNTVFLCKDAGGIVHNLMVKIPWLKDYTGPIDANCIITKDGRCWFLEWTFRFGYSALFLFLSLIKKGKLSTFFLKKFKAEPDRSFVASQVITLHPFPHVRDKPALYGPMIKDNLINSPIDTKGAWWVDVYKDSKGKLRCAGADGYLGVILDRGATAEEAIKACHKRVAEIKKAGISGDLQHRTEHDHLESHLGRLEKFKSWGINLF